MKNFKNSRNKDFYDTLSFSRTLAFVILFIVDFILVFVPVISILLITFSGAEFCSDASFNIIRAKSVFNNALNTAFCSSFFMSAGIWFLKGDSLVSSLMPNNMAKRAKNEFNDERKRRYGKNHKKYCAFLAVMLFAFSVFNFISSIDGIGYYNDYVKFNNSSVCFKTVDVKYEDLSIYKVHYDDKKPVENAYVIADGKGNYYNYGEIEPDGKIQQKLNEIAEKYHKEFIDAESIDDIPLGD